MPKKIHKLTDKDVYDFGLVGISSPENDYRISWIINNSLGYRLTRQENLVVYHKRLDEPQTFAQFLYFDEEVLLQYRLLANKCNFGYLLEELNNIDYLLQVSGELNEKLMNDLVNALKSVDGIRMAFRINPSSLKSKEKLLI